MFSLPLAVANSDTATFDCSFSRGCDSGCCKNGRPPVGPAEREAIDGVLARALPLMRPAARAAVERDGFASARTKGGNPMVRVAGGWCVFFNAGCALHTVGAEDGDPYRYKPAACALFPLEKHGDEWHVRQWGHDGEAWDLFCLNPANSARPAVEALAAEIALAARLEAASGAAAGCGGGPPGA